MKSITENEEIKEDQDMKKNEKNRLITVDMGEMRTGMNKQRQIRAKTAKNHSFHKQTTLIAMLHGQMQPMWQKRVKNRIINRTNGVLAQMPQF